MLASPSGEMPEEMLVELEREQRLRDAIGELASRCRDLVQMLFFAVPRYATWKPPTDGGPTLTNILSC